MKKIRLSLLIMVIMASTFTVLAFTSANKENSGVPILTDTEDVMTIFEPNVACEPCIPPEVPEEQDPNDPNTCLFWHCVEKQMMLWVGTL